MHLDLPWNFECEVVHPRDIIFNKREKNEEHVSLFRVSGRLSEVNGCPPLALQRARCSFPGQNMSCLLGRLHLGYESRDFLLRLDGALDVTIDCNNTFDPDIFIFKYA